MGKMALSILSNQLKCVLKAIYKVKNIAFDV